MGINIRKASVWMWRVFGWEKREQAGLGINMRNVIILSVRVGIGKREMSESWILGIVKAIMCGSLRESWISKYAKGFWMRFVFKSCVLCVWLVFEVFFFFFFLEACVWVDMSVWERERESLDSKSAKNVICLDFLAFSRNDRGQWKWNTKYMK
jgi:hypothetical protein